MRPLKNGEAQELLAGGSGRGARCSGNRIVTSGWPGVGAPGSPAHRFLQTDRNCGRFLIMGLRIFDGVIFEISRVLESLFDRLEYRAAKRAQRRKHEAPDRREPISDPLPYLYPTHLTK